MMIKSPALDIALVLHNAVLHNAPRAGRACFLTHNQILFSNARRLILFILAATGVLRSQDAVVDVKIPFSGHMLDFADNNEPSIMPRLISFKDDLHLGAITRKQDACHIFLTEIASTSTPVAVSRDEGFWNSGLTLPGMQEMHDALILPSRGNNDDPSSFLLTLGWTHMSILPFMNTTINPMHYFMIELLPFPKKHDHSQIDNTISGQRRIFNNRRMNNYFNSNSDNNYSCYNSVINRLSNSERHERRFRIRNITNMRSSFSPQGNRLLLLGSSEFLLTTSAYREGMENEKLVDKNHRRGVFKCIGGLAFDNRDLVMYVDGEDRIHWASLLPDAAVEETDFEILDLGLLTYPISTLEICRQGDPSMPSYMAIAQTLPEGQRLVTIAESDRPLEGEWRVREDLGHVLSESAAGYAIAALNGFIYTAAFDRQNLEFIVRRQSLVE